MGSPIHLRARERRLQSVHHIRFSWVFVHERLIGRVTYQGGAFDGMLAMFSVRHKISTWYFKFGLPVLLVLDAITIAYLLQLGVV